MREEEITEFESPFESASLNDSSWSNIKHYSPKTFILTSAQACYEPSKDEDMPPAGAGEGKAIPHENLLESFEKLKEITDGRLVIFPIAGKNCKESILHEDLEDRNDIFLGSQLVFNSNLQYKDIVVPPQNVDPTTGRTSAVSKYGSSIIIAHSKQRYLPVPVFNSQLPRYIYTTGAVTLPNYNLSNSKGDIADRNHVLGGLIVEVLDNKYYHIRNLRADEDGKFVDLGWEFDGSKDPKRIGVEAIVLGDIHWGDHDEQAIKANDEMIQYFQPKVIMLHDFFDGWSINHHEEDNYIRRARELKRGRLSLEDELKEDYSELVRLSLSVPQDVKIKIVASNHHRFLQKYINSDRWKEKGDLWNAEMASYLFNKAIEAGRYLSESNLDDSVLLLQEGMKRFGPIPRNVEFLKAQDNCLIKGYQLAIHGDKGKNGGKGGNAKARSITGGGKSITGHSHAMEIYENTYIVGTSSRRDLPYTFGSSNAQIAANAVLYNNGAVQLIPSIEGNWALKDRLLWTP
ncbi:MAG TPA: hypothetical protein PLK34_00275 [Candidatus Pacearchaeota archaeon]|nr:hypothetical protein [Candidatus Pacearchaeota archaeon]